MSRRKTESNLYSRDCSFAYCRDGPRRLDSERESTGSNREGELYAGFAIHGDRCRQVNLIDRNIAAALVEDRECRGRQHVVVNPLRRAAIFED